MGTFRRARDTFWLRLFGVTLGGYSDGAGSNVRQHNLDTPFVSLNDSADAQIPTGEWLCLECSNEKARGHAQPRPARAQEEARARRIAFSGHASTHSPQP